MYQGKTITGASATNGNNSSGGGKKPYSGGFVKKKEGEVSNVSFYKGKVVVRVPYYQTPAIAPQQQYAPPRNYQQNQRPQGKRGQQRQQRYPERKLDPIPMSYAQLLPQLLAGQLVQLREMGPPPTELPRGYDVNVRCEFHSGAPGHSIENCRALKYKVQSLLDAKELSFAPIGPNVQNNPMPPHHGAAINVIGLDDGHGLVTHIEEIQMSMTVLREHLLQQEVL